MKSSKREREREREKKNLIESKLFVAILPKSHERHFSMSVFSSVAIE